MGDVILLQGIISNMSSLENFHYVVKSDIESRMLASRGKQDNNLMSIQVYLDPAYLANLALVVPVRASSSSSLSLVATVSNPETIEEVSQQAANAIGRAIQEGKSRQLLQFLLPVDQRQLNYLDTEPRDYPCSIRDEFIACCKVTKSILRRLGGREGNEEILVKRIETLKQVGILFKWILDKDSGQLRIPYLQTDLGRVLRRYAAQIHPNRLGTAWIQEQFGGILDESLLHPGDNLDQSLVEETVPPEMEIGRSSVIHPTAEEALLDLPLLPT
ncbi:hypothetical protein L7F22_060251 [Adiantum nelumboides]|nr:hypothetical protein [Adiantum nelumboides]